MDLGNKVLDWSTKLLKELFEFSKRIEFRHLDDKKQTLHEKEKRRLSLDFSILFQLDWALDNVYKWAMNPNIWLSADFQPLRGFPRFRKSSGG